MAASYLEAYRSGRLAESIRRGLLWMRSCTLCPRMCRVNRMEGETGYCRTERLAVVDSYGQHYGEEAPLVGSGGSGTIFVTHCNLYCIFCQNFDVSHGGSGRPVGAEELARVMIDLQDQGCHNINFVTPGHVIPQILEALTIAIGLGLEIPLVYNSNGYDRVAALRLLDGIVDVYMPDFKFWGSEAAERLCGARDYPERARAALREMHRQVGDLRVENGVAVRGLLVRHLVMPEGLAGSADIFRFVARELSPDVYVNVMAQYHPCGEAIGRRDVGRRITPEEYQEALRAAREAGLRRLDRAWPRFPAL